jgi:hypothetical protein
MAIEGGVFTNLNKRNGYSFPPFMSQFLIRELQSKAITSRELDLGKGITLQGCHISKVIV